MLSTIDDQNLKDLLVQKKDSLENPNDKSIFICTGMMFDFHRMEYEIVKVKEDCMIAKSATNDEETEFRDFSVVSSACAQKLEHD